MNILLMNYCLDIAYFTIFNENDHTSMKMQGTGYYWFKNEMHQITCYCVTLSLNLAVKSLLFYIITKPRFQKFCRLWPIDYTKVQFNNGVLSINQYILY